MARSGGFSGGGSRSFSGSRSTSKSYSGTTKTRTAPRAQLNADGYKTTSGTAGLSTMHNHYYDSGMHDSGMTSFLNLYIMSSLMNSGHRSESGTKTVYVSNTSAPVPQRVISTSEVKSGDSSAGSVILVVIISAIVIAAFVALALAFKYRSKN